jgi:hypothetical protein
LESRPADPKQTVPNTEQALPSREPTRRWPHEPLRSVLIESLRCCVDAGAPGEDVAAALVRCAREARAAGLKSEQLVVTLRELWNESYGHSLPWQADARATTLIRLVDIALTAYYRDDALAPDPFSRRFF